MELVNSLCTLISGHRVDIYISGLPLRVRNKKCFSYFSSITYVVGTQKHHLSSFELPKHMLKMMGKKIFTI